MTDDQSKSETDSYSLSRRGILALFGAGAVSHIPTAVATSERQVTEDPKQPSRSLPWKETQYPLPVAAEELGYRQYVPAREPIHHTASWRTVGNEEATKLKELFRVAEITFTVAGDEVRPAEGTWEWKPIPFSATENKGYTQWERRWSYSTPAKDPGTYDYAVEVTYTQPYISKTVDGETIRTGTETHQGTYRVGPPPSRPDS